MSLSTLLGRAYGAVGRVAYNTTIGLEATLYGLRRAVVDVGDSQLMSYQGGPANAKEAVVLVHGFSADKVVWVRFAKHFTKRYRVLVLDLPGHGDTAYNPALNHSAASQAIRVLRAMDALGIARAHVVGNSMGGFIAARMAHDHPHRVASATLVDAAGVHSPQPSTMEKMLATGRNPFEVHNQADFRTFYGMTMARPPWFPGMALYAVGQRYIAQRAQLTHIFKDFFGVGVLDEQLGQIRAPVLVMWGRHDQLIHVSAADVWARGIPGAKKVVYDDLGHMPMLESPARAARDVLNFIESLPK